MDRVDGYLSNRAQRIWPAALVFELTGGAWVLRRPDQQDLGLGDSYSAAKQAIDAMLRAERAKA